jgi:hypothetical protein
MSIRGIGRIGATVANGQIYQGGQVVNTTTTFYAVPGTYADDLNILQKVITQDGYNITPQQVIATGAVDGYVVGSLNINVATSAVPYAAKFIASQPAPVSTPAPAPSQPPPTGGTSASPPPIGQPSGPFTTYTPVSPPAPVSTAPPAPVSTYVPPAPVSTYVPPNPFSAPTPTPAPATPAPVAAGGYNFIAASAQTPVSADGYPSDYSFTTDTTAAPATTPAPSGLMSSLSTLPWYYWAGGAAAALLLFSGGSKR